MAKYVLSSGDLSPFFREIVALTGKESPSVLWIGMDMQGVQNEFCGCKTDVLTTADATCVEAVNAKLEKTDIVIVDGENTFRTMQFLKRHGIDRLLLDASSKKDVVFCGVGEGVNLLCAYGQACTDKITSRRMTGWGLVDLVFCPHVVDEPQRTGFLKSIMKRTYRIPAVALDHAALMIDGERYRVLSAVEGSRARKCYWYKGQYYTDNIKSNEWHPLEKLMQKG